jgi:hypothetical protein
LVIDSGKSRFERRWLSRRKKDGETGKPRKRSQTQEAHPSLLAHVSTLAIQAWGKLFCTVAALPPEGERQAIGNLTAIRISALLARK